MFEKFESIKSKWKSLQAENPKLRIRDAAKQLEVSEACLLSTEINESVSYLNVIDYNSFLLKVLSLDKIMLLTRTDYVVHEKTLSTKDVKLKDNKIIDTNTNDPVLKFNPKLFTYFFSQNKIHAKRYLRSFQIFDANGDAVLKIYLKGNDRNKFDSIEKEYSADYNYELQLNTNSDDLKVENILKNKKYKERYVYSVEKNILREILTNTSKISIPIQIQAIGKGTIQYHRDLIGKVIDFGPWINIIDKTFNLHAIEGHLKKVILNKYIHNSITFYSVDFYDKNGDQVLVISSIKNSNDNFNSMIDKINNNAKPKGLVL